uniref:Primase n=1 Tax=Gonatozygon brebissonii TaxID=184482 RepID=A0A6G9IF00_9VIRI|nr:primase [Gonatozygon brebissonii]QIQ23039.1 primase [Gonatozygon brebissonii]
MAEELPGFLNWVMEVDKATVTKILKNLALTPSFMSARDQAKEISNPLLRWIKEEIISGEGSFLGFKSGEGIRAEHELSRRQALYPTYERWSARQGIRPLAHTVFSEVLLRTLKDLNYPSEKIRKNQGIFVTGIKVREGVYDRDYRFGAPLVTDHSYETSQRLETSQLEYPPRDTSKTILLYPKILPNNFLGNVDSSTTEEESVRGSYPLTGSKVPLWKQMGYFGKEDSLYGQPNYVEYFKLLEKTP